MSVPNSPQRGFTLIEIAVAVAVMTVFLLALFASLTSSQLASIFAREQQASSEAALRQLDNVLSIPELNDIQRAAGAYAFDVPYGDDIDGDGVPDFSLVPADNAFEPLNPAPNQGMAGHVTIVELDDYDGDSNSDYIEVQVTVAWRSAALSGSNPFQRFEVLSRRAR